MASNRKIWMWKIDLNFVYSIKFVLFFLLPLINCEYETIKWNILKHLALGALLNLRQLKWLTDLIFIYFRFLSHSTEQEQHHQNTVFFEWLVNIVEKKNQLSNKVCTTISIEIQFIHLKGKRNGENSRFSLNLYDCINTDSTFFFYISFFSSSHFSLCKQQKIQRHGNGMMRVIFIQNAMKMLIEKKSRKPYRYMMNTDFER